MPPAGMSVLVRCRACRVNRIAAAVKKAQATPNRVSRVTFTV